MSKGINSKTRNLKIRRLYWNWLRGKVAQTQYTMGTKIYCRVKDAWENLCSVQKLKNECQWEDYEDFLAEPESALRGGGTPPDSAAAVAAAACAAGNAEWPAGVEAGQEVSIVPAPVKTEPELIELSSDEEEDSSAADPSSSSSSSSSLPSSSAQVQPQVQHLPPPYHHHHHHQQQQPRVGSRLRRDPMPTARDNHQASVVMLTLWSI